MSLPLKKIFTLLVISVFLSTFATANDLKDHSSPYLAMHGDDPINWMEWNEATLEKARKENKLIFVSIGYFACHWCHVMHRESFTNKKIAKKLNDNYIAIKVDRELNPILDKRLIDFVSVTRGQAGWPLNVFLTPSGNPIAGVTYLPRDAFSASLTRLTDKWNKKGNTLNEDAKDLNQKVSNALNNLEKEGKKPHIADNADTLVSEIMAFADTFEGGFGKQTKFPSSPQLHALLNLNKKRKKPEIDTFIQLTLDAMSKKGLHDEIGGGFYRYTVDQGWNTPHYEKMLYNNTLLPMLYLDAADYYKRESYRETALETLSFLQDAMEGKSGGFIASLSAVDDKNVEGGYYLWTQKQLKKILSPDELQLAIKAWEINPTEGTLPVLQTSLSELAKDLNQDEETVEKQLSQLKHKLKQYRDKKRIVPQDYKQLIAWNGLALAAFAQAVNIDQKLKARGQRLADFLISMWDGKQLHRSAASKKAGTINDYAAASWGLLRWAKATGDEPSKKLGKQLADYAWLHFHKDGQWLEAPKVDAHLLPEGVQALHITDEPYPSAETLLIKASFLADNKALERKANKVLSLSTKAIEANPYSYASLIEVAEKFK